MKRIFLAATMVIVLALAGCGGSSPPPTVITTILSSPALDGDIAVTGTSTTVTQGMVPPVQSVFAGITGSTEYRAFLDFPLTGLGGVPGNAVIVSAFLDIFINNIQPLSGTIPIRIDLLNKQSTLIAADFDRTSQPALTTTLIVPAISQADFGHHVTVDVTPLMVEAQRLGLLNFQLRILEELGPVSPGLIEINDTTGVNRATLAPALQVTYF
ncbi:MAG TPA: hypothetical protein VI389_00295 [Geobacteraceae bacterium]